MVAFNAGSQGSISNRGDGMVVAEVTINTLVCAMAGALTGLLYHHFVLAAHLKNWSFASAINGSFVGMVRSRCSTRNLMISIDLIKTSFLMYRWLSVLDVTSFQYGHRSWLAF